MDHSDDVDLVFDQDVVNAIGEAPEGSSSDVNVSDRIEERSFLDSSKDGLDRVQESFSQSGLALFIPTPSLFEIGFDRGAEDQPHARLRRRAFMSSQEIPASGWA